MTNFFIFHWHVATVERRWTHRHIASADSIFVRASREEMHGANSLIINCQTGNELTTGKKPPVNCTLTFGTSDSPITGPQSEAGKGK